MLRHFLVDDQSGFAQAHCSSCTTSRRHYFCRADDTKVLNGLSSGSLITRLLREDSNVHLTMVVGWNVDRERMEMMYEEYIH